MICTTAKCIFTIALSVLSPTKVDKDQAFCMAMNVYHEARAESIAGQVQVAHATLARVKDPRFEETVCDVVKKKTVNTKSGNTTCQFSWVCTKPSNDIVFKNKEEIDNFKVATAISVNVLSGTLPDMCDGANFYYNPSLANPNWGHIYPAKCRIGGHLFLKPKGRGLS